MIRCGRERQFSPELNVRYWEQRITKGIAMTKKSSEAFPRFVSHWEGVCLWVIVCLFVFPGEVDGQVIDTNRPGFSSSPNVVEPGQWQIETGIAYAPSSGGDRTTSLPLVEIRTGVDSRVEVFLSSLSWSKTNSNGSNSSGLMDMVLGTKIRTSNADARTQMALLFQLSVPTGNSDFSSDRWDPSVAFIWAHGGDLPIAGTVKVSEFQNGYQLDNGVKVPFSWSEAHSGFVEWEATLPEGGGSTHWLNGGYQWLIEDHIQLDFNVGLGLNDRAADYRVGVGFSIRP
jgi:hypothetical protein